MAQSEFILKAVIYALNKAFQNINLKKKYIYYFIKQAVFDTMLLKTNVIVSRICQLCKMRAVVLVFCCSGRIPRLSLNQHSLYVGVVEKSPSPPLTGEQYGKMEPKYPEGSHCQSVLRPQGILYVPLYFK